MRKQSVTVRCDGDGCKSYVDVDDLRQTPATWYHVDQADALGKVQPHGGFDLCSVKCVEKWAKARRPIVEKTPAGRRVLCPECTEPIGARGLNHHYRSKHPDAAPLETRGERVYADA